MMNMEQFSYYSISPWIYLFEGIVEVGQNVDIVERNSSPPATEIYDEKQNGQKDIYKFPKCNCLTECNCGLLTKSELVRIIQNPFQLANFAFLSRVAGIVGAASAKRFINKQEEEEEEETEEAENNIDNDNDDDPDFVLAEIEESGSSTISENSDIENTV